LDWPLTFLRNSVMTVNHHRCDKSTFLGRRNQCAHESQPIAAIRARGARMRQSRTNA
jgi:hypothetical protein